MQRRRPNRPLIVDVRACHRVHPDWRDTRQKIEEIYGYDKYPGICHVVPNHALMVMAVLYARDDFQRAQMIVNTSGWDTDCNAGNIGCLLGIMDGLDGLDAGPDWRGPVADRLLISSADGGNSITDAVRQAYYPSSIGSHWPAATASMHPRAARGSISPCPAVSRDFVHRQAPISAASCVSAISNSKAAAH